jgi:hypothetical protein
MDVDDPSFFSYCEKRHRDNVLRFLRALTQFKSAMLQPLGGRTASSILAEEIISQYIDPKGPNCVASISPGVRGATLERWAQIGKDYSRLQRTFFDQCRGEVERGELADLATDYKAYVLRLEQESARKESEGEATVSGRSMLGSVLSSIRKSTETLSSKGLVPRNKSGASASTSSSLPLAFGAPEPELPLSVHVATADNVAKLQVDLVAASTHLSWIVERNWAEFKDLYASLRRYKVWVPVLPKTMDIAKKIEVWLEEVLHIAQLSASREVYSFLKIGNTVDLLAQAARTKRSTIAVLKPASEERDELASLSRDDLAAALDNLAAFEQRPDLPHVKSDGSVRARKIVESGSDVSAEDIAAALKHLLNLQFTDSPMKTLEEEQLERQIEENEESDNDREEETTEAETTSAPNTFDSYPLDTSGGALMTRLNEDLSSSGSNNNGNMNNDNNTADFDWRAICTEQKVMIEHLKARVRQLEKELEIANRGK